MMNGAALKTMIEGHFNRTDLTSVVASMAAVAVKKLERDGYWFQQASTTVATTPGTSYVSYPSDFVMEMQDGLKDTSGNSLLKTDFTTIDQWIRYSAGSGLPSYYALADKIYLYPIPDATYNLPILYQKSLGFPADTSSNAWSVDAYDVTFWATVEEVWRYLRNTEEEAKARVQKGLLLKDLRHQSGRITGTGQVVYRDF
jgi:hypothetical protein